MSITDIISMMPCWYFLIMILFSLFYAIRGIMYYKVYGDKNLTHGQKVVIEYVQEFLFKVVCTISGFIALFIANYIFSSLKSITDIGVGTGVLLVFLFIWGITGLSGYLSHLIVLGKLPVK